MLAKCHEVAITGVGCISAIGLSEEETMASLRHSYCGLTSADADMHGGRVLGRIKNFKIEKFFEAQDLKVFYRNSLMNILAARLAIKDSEVNFSELDPFETIVLAGSQSSYGIDEEDFFKVYFSEPQKRVHPLTLVQFMRGNMIHQICKENRIHGAGYVLDSACASGLHAIGEAFHQIQTGRASYAVAGCAESPFGETHLKAWEAIGALSKNKCQPFDRDRTGTILGEGGSYFILERLDLAIKRSAKIYGVIESFFATRDGNDFTKPSLDMISETMRRAIKLAHKEPEDIQYISAHGSGTRLNDVNEVSAIKDVFGKGAYNLDVSATKSMHGHLEFATGNVELAIVLLAQRNGLLPPTLNLENPDPECDLNFLPRVPKEQKVQRILKNSFGFGGANASMIVRTNP